MTPDALNRLVAQLAKLPGIGEKTAKRLSFYILRAPPEYAQELVAASSGSDLVVVGSRGGGGFARLHLGSVSDQVAHHAHCPVVIIPHANR